MGTHRPAKTLAAASVAAADVKAASVHGLSDKNQRLGRQKSKNPTTQRQARAIVRPARLLAAGSRLALKHAVNAAAATMYIKAGDLWCT